MDSDIIKLFVGFLLTSVLGGSLGYYFQGRAWRHQFSVRLLETEQATATRIFEELSRLMDKRLYRMRQVYWKLSGSATTPDVIEEHMNRYREVLYEWNDSLNRSFALTEAYFGCLIRNVLEGSIYEEFSRIGRTLESRYLEFRSGEKSTTLEGVGRELTALGHQIYELNIMMIRSIQKRQVGLSSTQATGGSFDHRPGPLGDQGWPAAGPR